MGELQVRVDDRIERTLMPPPDESVSRVRVLELGTLIAGPFTGRLLGDFGAAAAFGARIEGARRRSGSPSR